MPLCLFRLPPFLGRWAISQGLLEISIYRDGSQPGLKLGGHGCSFGGWFWLKDEFVPSPPETWWAWLPFRFARLLGFLFGRFVGANLHPPHRAWAAGGRAPGCQRPQLGGGELPSGGAKQAIFTPVCRTQKWADSPRNPEKEKRK